MNDNSDSGFLVLLIFLSAIGVFAFIGHLIGKSKGRSTGGAAMGALLGPVGLVGAAFLSDKRRQCPACKGHVPDDARKCMHCGEDLPRQPVPFPRDQIPRQSSLAGAAPQIRRSPRLRRHCNGALNPVATSSFSTMKMPLKTESACSLQPRGAPAAMPLTTLFNHYFYASQSAVAAECPASSVSASCKSSFNLF